MAAGLTPRVHDLLRLRSGRVAPAHEHEPDWTRATLAQSPWVVVRREYAAESKIAVGVRGTVRHERWAGLADPANVLQAIGPGMLRSRTAVPARSALRAIQALQYAKDEMARWSLEWGPVGSVGYELASGRQVTTEESDLDLVIYAPEQMEREVARDLFNTLRFAPAKIDVRIETPYGGFALAEYAREYSAKILLRTARGRLFVQDPWAALSETELR